MSRRAKRRSVRLRYVKENLYSVLINIQYAYDFLGTALLSAKEVERFSELCDEIETRSYLLVDFIDNAADSQENLKPERRLK